MRMRLDVDAVAFDVGNTLTTSPLPDALAGAGDSLGMIMRNHGSSVSPKALVEAWAEADRRVNFPFATHFLQEEPIIQAALARLGVPAPVRALTAPELLAACRREIQRVLATRDTRDVRAAAEALRRRGKRLAVLSNDRAFATPTLVRWLGLDGVFEVIVISEEVGHEKPSPEVFKALCDRMQLRPGRIAYVGDDTLRDVAAGRGAGLRVILWRPGGRAHEETSWATSGPDDVEPDAVLTAWADLPDMIA